jgi:hypothetical protein
MAQTHYNSQAQQGWQELIFADGGKQIFELFGYELGKPNLKQNGLSIIFNKKAQKYTFKHWSSGVGGDAVAFWKFINACDSYKSAYQQIIVFLKNQIVNQGDFAKIAKNPTLPAYKKEPKQENNQGQSKEFNYLRKELNKQELEYWSDKIGFIGTNADLSQFLTAEGMFSLPSASYGTQKFENLNFVFAFETIKNNVKEKYISDLRLIQPKAELGRGYYLRVKEKRAFFPNLNQTKQIDADFGYTLGLDQPYTIQKPIYWASGEPDYLALRARGLQAICLAGEGMDFKQSHIKKMNENGYGTENLTIVFDNDEAGEKFAKKFAQKYQIPYVLLPKVEGKKDVCDFVGKKPDQTADEHLFELTFFDRILACCLEKEFCPKNKHGQTVIKTNEKYLSECKEALYALKYAVLDHRITFLDAGAGFGKSSFFLDKKGEFINDSELKEKGILDFVIFIVPTKNLAQQNEISYQVTSLYGGKSSTIEGTNLINCVFDSMARIGRTPSLIIPDEFHTLTADFAYRYKVNSDIFDLMQTQKDVKFICLSATPSFAIIDYFKKNEEKLGKVASIRIENPETQRIEFEKIVYNLIKDGGEYTEIELIQKELEKALAEGKKVVLHKNSKEGLAKIALCLEKAKQIAKENYDFFQSDPEGFETEEMQNIREKSLISEHIKLLAVTNSFNQGININNEGELELLVSYANRAKRLRPDHFVQLCYRFRKANVKVKVITPQIPALDSTEKFNLLQRNKEMTKIWVKYANTLPTKKKKAELMGEIEGGSEQTKYKNSFSLDKNAVIFDGTNFKINELYYLALAEEITYNSLSTEQWFEKVVEIGRGIKEATKTEEITENFTEIQTLEEEQVVESTIETEPTEEKNEVVFAKSSAFTKEVNRMSKKNKEKFIQDLLEEFKSSPEKILKHIIENSQDEALKKRAFEFVKNNLGFINLAEIEESSLVIKKGTIHTDIVRKYTANFLRIKSYRGALSHKEVADLLEINDTDRSLEELFMKYEIEDLSTNKESIKENADTKEFSGAYFHLKNITLFSQLAQQLLKEEKCYDTFNKTNSQRKEWNYKKFIQILMENLQTSGFYSKAKKHYSKYHIMDLFGILFNFKTEMVNYYKNPEDNAQKEAINTILDQGLAKKAKNKKRGKLVLIKDCKAVFEW